MTETPVTETPPADPAAPAQDPQTGAPPAAPQPDEGDGEAAAVSNEVLGKLASHIHDFSAWLRSKGL